MPKLLDLVGKTFNRWTVLEYAGSRKGKPRWLCRCECGVVADVKGWTLKNGDSKSCGCYTKDRLRVSPPGTKHGKRYTSEYSTWQGMKDRCLVPKCPAYHRYGGRGITICERWLNSFENFYADMGPKPSPKHSIERINNDGNYEPGNCKWATAKEQANNRHKQSPYVRKPRSAHAPLPPV